MTACCSSLRKSCTQPWKSASSATEQDRSAPVKSQSSKFERRRSAPRSTAPTNLHPLKFDARMSQPDRSAPLKSQPSKSFQHIRDSDKSLLAKLTRMNQDRPKNERGSVRLPLSASSSRYL